ncbi:MAG TPA: MMPL family transporter [Verrucomicrobiae bacterium]
MSSFLKRWWWALLLVAVGLGLARLRFDVDVLDLLPPDEPTVQGLKLYQQHFTNARELVVSLRAPDADTAEKVAGELAERLREETNLVAEVSWQPPWMEHPEQLGELLGWLWFNQPPRDFSTLTNRLEPPALKAALDETRELLATSMSPMDLARRSFDPFNLLTMPGLTNISGMDMSQGNQGFASADGKYRLLYVESAVDLSGYRECDAWLGKIRAVVDAALPSRERLGVRQPSAAIERPNAPNTSDATPAEHPNTPAENIIVHYTGRPVFVQEIAASMQHDMSHSVGITSSIIALLFWLTHRRWKPMLWLLTLLMLILGATLALGALLLGHISVVALGFAAVLLGLAVDYAVVHYQEALAHPQMTVPEIRRAIAPSILWAAITTMSAFLVLNLGGLPGLGQLGSLVAIGIALSALVMVMIYLPPLFPERRQPRLNQPPFRWWDFFVAPAPPPAGSCGETRLQASGPCGEAPHLPPGLCGEAPHLRATVITGLVFIAAVGVLIFHRPGLDRSGDALQPAHGEAQQALDEMTVELGLPPQPLWLIVPGRDEAEVFQRMTNAEVWLNGAVKERLIGKYLLPDTLWPRGEFQSANRTTAAILGTKGPLLRETALAAGFNTNALLLSENMVQIWAQAGHGTTLLWPTNQVSRWLLQRFVARSTDQCLVMGLVYPATNHVDPAALTALSKNLADDHALLSGWELLGHATLKRVQSRMWMLVVPMIVLVLLSLWFAFRRAKEILLGLAVLGFSGVCLLAVMALAGWKWNLMNLMALPLILGTGVDYAIFIQLALRRHGGDLLMVRRSVGRALMLCGGTAVAGFGSLAFSSNLGMASLGQVCAVGIAANALIAIFLLPSWWRSGPQPGSSSSSSSQKVSPPTSRTDCGQSCESGNNCSLSQRERAGVRENAPPAGEHHPLLPSAPSSHGSKSHGAQPAFYRGAAWKLGLASARIFPAPLLKMIASGLADLYWLFQRGNCQTVVNNFLPVFRGDRVAAEKAARAAHRNFAAKLIDLWRVESGEVVRNWITTDGELEIIHAARRRGRGTLFITLHLGNWEHGGQLLNQLGIRLTILTQAEPDDGLTDLRKAARARYGVDTLIIGDDGFAFVEVIKRLQAGADMAVSLDRPPDRGGVPVEFFGHPFEASLAAAELARASGCALIGVTIVRRPAGYAVKVLPEFVYDRKALGSRDARRELTQQILRAFEPEIRKNVEQWYQFTPIWPQ